MLISALEWIAFGGSLLSVWLYGKNQVNGAAFGIFVSLVFILYGVLASIWPAVISNVVFAYLHYRNLRKGIMMDWNIIKKKVSKDFGYFQKLVHTTAEESGWWPEKQSEEELYKIVPTKLCLIHSEVSEAMEGHRKNLMDDKLPHHKMIATELADVVIRCADLAGALGIDLGQVIADKMEFNSVRPDHKIENREKEGGKKY